MTENDSPLQLRAGGVPEHFNFAWHREEARRCWAHANLSVSWEDFPGGTGAIVEALRQDRIDLAAVLTEGAVAAIARGEPLRVISTWIDSPLLWGVHVAADHPAQSIEDLRDGTFAISRYGSGSHLMAAVMASERRWPDLRYALVGTLDGARRTMGAGGADGFLWEKYTTKPLVDAGEWRRVGVVPTPWPGFVIVASERAIAAHRGRLVELLRGLRDTLAAVPGDEVRRFVSRRYRLAPEDVADWYGQTRWRCNWWEPAPALEPAISALRGAGLLGREIDANALCWTS